jgi:hypothetical protein
MDSLQSSSSDYAIFTTGSHSEAHISIPMMEYDGNAVDLKSSIEDPPPDPLGARPQVATEGNEAALCAFVVPETTDATSTHQAPDSATAILAYRDHSSKTPKDLTKMVIEHSGGSGLVIQNIIGSSLSTSVQVD